MAFADNLKRCRAAKGLSPAEVATAAGVRERAYASWERGIGEPSLAALRKLAQAFGVSADELLAGVGDPPPEPPKPQKRPDLRPGLDAFFESMRASPEDDAPRLVCADWLADQGEQEWADYVRLACLAQRPASDASDADVLDGRMEAYKFCWDRLDPEKAERLAAFSRPRPDVMWRYLWEQWEGIEVRERRGFLDVVEARDIDSLLAALEGSLRTAPFYRLEVRIGSVEAARRLIASGALARLCDLQLTFDHPEEVAETLRLLGESDQLSRLTGLVLHAQGGNNFDPGSAVRALASGRGWGALRRLDVRLWEGYEPGMTAADLATLGEAPHLRGLTDLTVQTAQGEAPGRAVGESFPALKTLSVHYLSHEGAVALAGVDLPALRDLDVRLRSGGGRARPSADRTTMAALLLTPRFPRLGGLRVSDVYRLGGLGPLLRGPCRQPTLRSLYLGTSWPDMGLGPRDAAGIAQCAALRGLSALDLGGNPLESAGAVALASADWPRLVSLRLGRCRIGTEGAIALAGAKGMPELQELNLSGNDLGLDGYRAFTPGTFPHLRRLGVSANAGTMMSLRRRFGKGVEL
jgi:uncharacterized protein (TIGR02996 family)